MIEKIEDLELEDDNDLSTVEAKVLEKLGISVKDLKEALSLAVIDNAVELATEFVNIAPMGDYSKLLEDNKSIVEFLRTEAHKSTHWNLAGIFLTDEKKKLLTFNFHNHAVDDGDLMKGFVYVSFDGKIKHAFAQGE